MTCPIELSCTDPNHRRPLVTIETTDPAPTPPEVLREQVATVLASHEPHYHHETESFTCSPDGTDPAAQAGCLWRSDPDLADEEIARAFRLHVADAALAVFRGQQDPAVQRVLALLDPETGMASSPYGDGQRWFEEKDIRAAIGGDGR